MKGALLVAVAAALLVSVPAFADDTPNPAVAACKAEYQQLGATGFAAKYGQGEAGGRACVVAHGGTLPTPPPPPSSEPPANPAVAACKAEYQQLGATGFAAKYGQSDAGLKACVVAHGGTPPPPNGTEPPKAGDPTRSVAQALCAAEARSLGKDGFQAQYGSGKDGLAACAKAQAAKAQSILAACKATAGSSESALKQCVLAALKPGARS